MQTQPKPKLTEAQRTLAEFRNERRLAETLAGNFPALMRPTPAIADSGKVRLGDGFITAEFPPPTEFQARLIERKEQRFTELLRRLRPSSRTQRPGCVTMWSADDRGLVCA